MTDPSGYPGTSNEPYGSAGQYSTGPGYQASAPVHSRRPVPTARDISSRAIPAARVPAARPFQQPGSRQPGQYGQQYPAPTPRTRQPAIGPYAAAFPPAGLRHRSRGLAFVVGGLGFSAG